MNLSEYEQLGYNLYQEFALVVKYLLEQFIQRSENNFKLQNIQSRAKSTSSLKAKLDKDNKEDKNIEEFVSDLAGCRIIFYHNHDVKRFIESGVLNDEFEIIECKPHYPQRNNTEVKKLYRAQHYIVKLNDKRIKLTEYNNYKDLICEIQIHTILTHAWSETAHDIIYKPKSTKEFGKGLQARIEARMEKIMEEYIKPAGYEFDKVYSDYTRLLQSKVVFEMDLVSELNGAKDYNELYEILDKFHNYVLPLYNSFDSNNFELIKDLFFTTVGKIPNITEKEIKTPFGNMTGQSVIAVVKKILSIIDDVRYFDVKQAFSMLNALYLKFIPSDNKINNVIIESYQKLAAFNLSFIKEYSLLAQNFLLDSIKETDDSQKKYFIIPIAKICEAMLRPTIVENKYEGMQLTINQYPIPGDQHLKSLREHAINLLKSIYYLTEQEVEKEEVINAINTATELDRLHCKSDQTKDGFEMIMNNSINVLCFYKTLVEANESPAMLAKIDRNSYYLYFQNDDGAVKNIAYSIYTELSSNKEYQIYKTLCGGFDIFNDWTNEKRFVYEENNNLRKLVIDSYIEELKNPIKQKEWQPRIRYCAEQGYRNRNMVHLNDFFNKLAKEKPEYICDLLGNNFSLYIKYAGVVSGLVSSGINDIEIYNKIIEWTSEGNFLEYFIEGFIYRVYLNKEKLNIEHFYDLCAHITGILKNGTNLPALNNLSKLLLIVVIKTNSGNFEKLLQIVLVDLNRLKISLCSNGLYLNEEERLGLNSLSYETKNLMIKNLVFKLELEYSDELLLVDLIGNNPSEIIEFFCKRIDYKPSKKEDNGDLFMGYENIPYRLDELNKIFNNATLVVNSIMPRFKENEITFKFNEAELVKRLFPNFNEDLSDQIFKCINIKDESNINAILTIIDNYKHSKAIYMLYKKLIVIFDGYTNYLDLLLENLIKIKGVVRGSDGFINAYCSIKDEISLWLNDEDIKITEFAEKAIIKLNKMILYETQDADDRKESELMLRRV